MLLLGDLNTSSTTALSRRKTKYWYVGYDKIDKLPEVYPCKVISQGQHANLKSLQSPKPSWQKSLRKNYLCIQGWNQIDKQCYPLHRLLLSCFSKEHRTTSSTSKVWLRCRVALAQLCCPASPFTITESRLVSSTAAPTALYAEKEDGKTDRKTDRQGGKDLLWQIWYMFIVCCSSIWGKGD